MIYNPAVECLQRSKMACQSEDLSGGVIEGNRKRLYFYRSIFNPEIVEQCLIIILCRKAGVKQVAPYALPLLQATVVEELQFVGNDERHQTVRQALLEHYQASNTSIAVLERMYSLKALMKVYYILKRLLLF